MAQIPTAKEIYLSKVFPTSFENRRDEVELWFEISPDAQQSVEIMIEFAKLHVEAALKAAKEVDKKNRELKPKLNQRFSILNSYPLDKIK
jgi:hypothetical protein